MIAASAARRTEATALIVDDDPEFATELSQIVQDESDIDTLVAHSAGGAIRQLERILQSDAPVPVVIFLDLHMEDDFAGYRVLKYLDRNTQTRAVPVVMISSSGSAMDIKQAYAMGASSYLKKPVSSREMSDVLHKTVYYWCNINKCDQTAISREHRPQAIRVGVVRSDKGDFEFAKINSLGDHMRRANLSVSKLSRLSGVNHHTISNAAKGGAIRIGDLYRILRCLTPRMPHQIDFETEIERVQHGS